MMGMSFAMNFILNRKQVVIIVHVEEIIEFLNYGTVKNAQLVLHILRVLFKCIEIVVKTMGTSQVVTVLVHPVHRNGVRSGVSSF